MSASSINTVIPTLVSLLQARAGLAGVTVREGPPTVEERGHKELIQVLDASGDQTVRALNATTQPRNEEYDLAVVVSVVAEAESDQTTIRARAFALLAEIEAQLRSDPHLGIVNVAASIVGKIAYTARASDAWRESCIDFDIHVMARL